jgi:thioredoxin reductase (NADPH)
MTQIAKMTQTNKVNVEDVCIIGSGCAAYIAANYTSDANLKTIMFINISSCTPYNRIAPALLMENLSEFPKRIIGHDVRDLLRKQCIKLGTKIITDDVTKIDLSVRPFEVIFGTSTNEKRILTRSIIVATGATAKRLTFPQCYMNMKGISTNVRINGGAFLFSGDKVAIVGGGNDAMREALHFTKYASRVYIIHRRDKFRARKALQEKVINHPKVEVFWNTEVKGVFGVPGCLECVYLDGIQIRNNITRNTEKLYVKGLFFAIGNEAQSKFLKGQVETDEKGYIFTQPESASTNVKGVFAAGRVIYNTKHCEPIEAATSGLIAAQETIVYLENNNDI